LVMSSPCRTSAFALAPARCHSPKLLRDALRCSREPLLRAPVYGPSTSGRSQAGAT
jgi:hypothetical protein